MLRLDQCTERDWLHILFVCGSWGYCGWYFKKGTKPLDPENRTLSSHLIPLVDKCSTVFPHWRQELPHIHTQESQLQEQCWVKVSCPRTLLKKAPTENRHIDKDWKNKASHFLRRNQKGFNNKPSLLQRPSDVSRIRSQCALTTDYFFTITDHLFPLHWPLSIGARR